MNFQIYGCQTALASVHFITKSGTASLPEKAQDVNDLRQHLLMCELEWNRVLLTMPSTSDADVSMPKFEPQHFVYLYIS